LELDETTTCKGIPITTPARTVLDLAADSTERELEQALAQAEARHLTSRRKLLLLLARYPGRRGVRALRRLLERDARPALTRSEAEERFLALIRKSGLPHPDVNVNLGRYEVDFLWREHRLVVEIDGYAHHSDRESFEADRARDAWLAAQGHTVIRVTWRQLVDEPEVVLARVAEALASRRA
jgi:very-short-patch-repair endonuclease